MDPHTEDRITSYEQKAANATARARAAYSAADTHSGRFQGGQPILLGHSSARGALRDRARSDAAMRRAIEAEKAAKYWKNKAESARSREKQKHNPGVIKRRIARLEADERAVLRGLAEAEEGGSPRNIAAYQERAANIAEKLAENRAELAASGVKDWGKPDFAKGDYAFRRGVWWEIQRVNPKTVTVGAILGSTNTSARIKGSPVYRLADNPYGWTDTIPYTEITGRISAADMNAKFAA